MKVLGYVRVSTEEQSLHGCSVQAQTAKIADYCKLYGLELVDTLIDGGISAKTMQRAGLQATLAKLENGEAEGIVIASLSRLTRSIRDWSLLIEKYFNRFALLSISDSVDTRSASGRMAIGMIVLVSQWEREAIGERTAVALHYKQKQGIHVGRIPYGFQIQNGKLVEDVTEKANIAFAQTLRGQGLSLEQIAMEFTSKGIATKRGGLCWRANTIMNLLKNKENKGGDALCQEPKSLIGAEKEKEAVALA